MADPASRQADLLSFVLRNYRRHGFRVAVNVESVAHWQRLSATVPAQFVKIDAASLLANGDAAKALDHLRERAGSAMLVVKRVEADLAMGLPDDVYVQGFAWGVPAPGAAATSPERHVSKLSPVTRQA